MKKLSKALVAILLMLSLTLLVSCGKDNDGDDGDDSSTVNPEDPKDQGATQTPIIKY